MDCALHKTKDESEMGEQMMAYSAELLRLKKELLAFYKDDVPLERGQDKSEMGEMIDKDVKQLTSLLAMISELHQTPE